MKLREIRLLTAMAIKTDRQKKYLFTDWSHTQSLLSWQISTKIRWHKSFSKSFFCLSRQLNTVFLFHPPAAKVFLDTNPDRKETSQSSFDLFHVSWRTEKDLFVGHPRVHVVRRARERAPHGKEARREPFPWESTGLKYMKGHALTVGKDFFSYENIDSWPRRAKITSSQGVKNYNWDPTPYLS